MCAQFFMIFITLLRVNVSDFLYTLVSLWRLYFYYFMQQLSSS